MKKVVLILMLSVFALGSSGFTSSTNLPLQEDCDDSYNVLYDFALDNGASEEVAQEQAGNYWANCVLNGGNSRILELISLIW